MTPIQLWEQMFPDQLKQEEIRWRQEMANTDFSPESFGLTSAWAKKRKKEYLENELHDIKEYKIVLLKLIAKNKKDEWSIEDTLAGTNTKIRSIEYKLNNKTKHKPFDLEAIKQVPIEAIMDRSPVYRKGDRDVYLCPLHNEKTPSFVVFKKENRYKCFGCSEGGSNIDLYMLINNCNFVEACRFLSA